MHVAQNGWNRGRTYRDRQTWIILAAGIPTDGPGYETRRGALAAIAELEAGPHGAEWRELKLTTAKKGDRLALMGDARWECSRAHFERFIQTAVRP
jgi:hypothetical protein